MRLPVFPTAILSSLLYNIHLTASLPSPDLLTSRASTATGDVVANFTIYTDDSCSKTPVMIVATKTSGIDTCTTNSAWGASKYSMTIASLSEQCQIQLYNRGGEAGCVDNNSQYLGTYAPGNPGPANGCVQIPNFSNPVGGIGDIVQAYLIACSFN